MMDSLMAKPLGLKAGEWVEVRSKDEILSTLDKSGRLDELPVMPQMLDLCGMKFQVHKRIHKLCSFATTPPGNRMFNAVSLKDVRCDGQVYGGCEMQCMIIWKEAWLKRVNQVVPSMSDGRAVDAPSSQEHPQCSEADIWAATRRVEGTAGAGEPVYVCQATQLPYATRPLSWSEWGQYVEDYCSGNTSIWQIASGLLFQFYHRYLVRSGIGLGSVFQWLYDVFQFIRGGIPYPWKRGQVSKNSRTPSAVLNLQIGELVRVKQYTEILKTLDDDLKNRGLGFHAELSIHCGNTFRVVQRPRKLMDERTGRLKVLKNECIVLEGTMCEGRYTDPLNCPRAFSPYWREVWLERVPEGTESPSDKRGASCRS